MWGIVSICGLVLLGLAGVASCGISNWSLVSREPHTHALKFCSLFFTDSDNGFAITATQLLETPDGGKTWTRKFPADDDKMFYSMQFVTASTGFIVGVEGNSKSHKALVLRTEDSGKTWHDTALALPADTDTSLFSISFCNPQIGWAVGPGLVLRTIDGGQSWGVQPGKSGEGFLDISCVSADQAWIVGMGGLLLQTTDSGKIWRQISSGTTANLARVRVFGNDAWIVGGLPESGVLLRSRDHGATWERIELNATAPLSDIYFKGKQGWIVGAKGTIFETSNGGQTWRQQDSPTDDDLACLFFISQNRGWAGGARQTVLLFSD